MIKSIFIRNYAIIDEIELQFDHNLNIITGETGAGKSIVIGAMSLLMGKRADTKVLFDTTKKCVIEAVFANQKQSISDILKDQDLDDEDQLFIRREILPSGKTRAFVNDTPVNLGVLQRLSIHLVDLNQQFELLEIQNADFHLKMLDAISGNLERVKAYGVEYRSYSNKKQRLEKLNQISLAALKEKEFVAFQLDELEKASLEQGEQELLESEQNKLNNTQELDLLVQETNFALEEEENCIVDRLNALSYKWEKYSAVDPQIQSLLDAFQQSIDQLGEAQSLNNEISRSLTGDPARLEEITERLDLIYKLSKKHQVQNVDELLEIELTLAEQLSQYENNDAEIQKLESEIKVLEGHLLKEGTLIRKERLKHRTTLEELINNQLDNLAMPNAQVKVQLSELEHFTKTGMDEGEILFSPNKGAQFLSIKKTASGGEIARLMLCMKSSVADVLSMPSLIFDEIDTGVSGEVALKMGSLLAVLAKAHQLIVITHSPQVASKAQKHFHIYKEDIGDRTVTRVKMLSKEERIVELAKMLSGDPPSNSAISNAKELIKISNN